MTVSKFVHFLNKIAQQFKKKNYKKFENIFGYNVWVAWDSNPELFG